jgi:hypothetical protein
VVTTKGKQGQKTVGKMQMRVKEGGQTEDDNNDGREAAEKFVKREGQ